MTSAGFIDFAQGDNIFKLPIKKFRLCGPSLSLTSKHPIYKYVGKQKRPSGWAMLWERTPGSPNEIFQKSVMELNFPSIEISKDESCLEDSLVFIVSLENWL